MNDLPADFSADYSTGSSSGSDGLGLGSFLSGLEGAYGAYVSGQNATQAAAAAQTTAQQQQQLALLNAQAQANSASTMKTILTYGILAAVVLGVIFVLKRR